MAIPITQVDAFTDKPFAGNPAAICLLDEPRSEPWMRAVAREMNLSETAFLVRHADAFNLRWFTPAIEVDLCGHATLASAHVLWEQGHLQLDEAARFHTRSGLLEAKKNGPWIEMNFPSTPAKPIGRVDALETALGATPKFTGQSRFDYLVELASEEEARALAPDFGLLRRLPVRGIIITSQSSSTEYDFVSRFFAPA
ncbi:MAG TPA: PhzF family phenazine biosynthesis protein, partial [Candidatus Acidoferrales bacterium]|nr:PhzF family phenazine biosynthesis protein [Candidatus Acidoferrales bacterium]